MSKEKKVNYTEADTSRMIEVYQAAGVEPNQEQDRKDAILEIQEFTGKTVNSIRAKLGFEGVYIPLVKTESKGKNSVSKSELVAAIQDGEPSKPSGFFDSLESANKRVLNYILDIQKTVNSVEVVDFLDDLIAD